LTLAQPASFNGECLLLQVLLVFNNLSLFLTETTGIMMSPANARYATLPLDRMKDKPPPPYGSTNGYTNGYQTTALMGNGHMQGHHVVVTDAGPNGVIPQVVYYNQ